MYIYMYVRLYVSVSERDRQIEREERKNIIYYTISFIFHIYFVTISSTIFTRKILVSHNLVFICFFIFLKFSLINPIFFSFLFSGLKNNEGVTLRG